LYWRRRFLLNSLKIQASSNLSKFAQKPQSVLWEQGSRVRIPPPRPLNQSIRFERPKSVLPRWYFETSTATHRSSRIVVYMRNHRQRCGRRWLAFLGFELNRFRDQRAVATVDSMASRNFSATGFGRISDGGCSMRALLRQRKNSRIRSQ
jgi:hypothetical protein